MTSVSVNGRVYRTPGQPTVVICFAPDYLAATPGLRNFDIFHAALNGLA